MKLSSTPKPIRFSFELDGRTFRSLDAIKADFKPFALKGKIDDGSFLRWLEQQNETELCNTIRNRDKVEVADVVEIVYGLTGNDIEKELRDKPRKERMDLLSYAIKINMLGLDVLEKCYLQFKPSDPIWDSCKEILEKSRNAKVINRLAAEYKREGNMDKYEKLIEYAAEKLKDEYAKAQWAHLTEPTYNYIDGVNVSRIRFKDDLIEVLKRNMSNQWYNLCNQKCKPKTTHEEETFLELVQLCGDICQAINHQKKRYSGTYCSPEKIQEVYKKKIIEYKNKKTAKNPMLDCAVAINKILDFSYKERGMGFHLIADLKEKEPWNRIDLMKLQGRTDKPGVLMTILTAILQQGKCSDDTNF